MEQMLHYCVSIDIQRCRRRRRRCWLFDVFRQRHTQTERQKNPIRIYTCKYVALTAYISVQIQGEQSRLFEVEYQMPHYSPPIRRKKRHRWYHVLCRFNRLNCNPTDKLTLNNTTIHYSYVDIVNCLDASPKLNCWFEMTNQR